MIRKEETVAFQLKEQKNLDLQRLAVEETRLKIPLNSRGGRHTWL